MTRGRFALLAGLLGLLPMLLPLSVDGSLPLISVLPVYFQTTTALVQYSLSSVVLGIALGQLVYGPLSDRFGRKPVLIAGISLYVATAIACSMAANIGELIGLRFFQGFFACSGIIVARAVIRDLFDREDAARLFALMMGIHGIMPTIAPGVSGWLTQTYGWQSVFWVMAGFGLFTGVSVLFGLSETNKSRSANAIQPSVLFRNYWAILGDRAFRSHAICACFMYGALMAYFAGAPVGLIQYLGLSPLEFGVAMAMPIVCYMVAQIAVARVMRGIGMNRMIRVGVALAAIAGSGMLVFVVTGVINVFTLMVPVVLILVSLAFVSPGTTAGAMSPFGTMAGAASSLLGFIQFAAAALATAIIGILNDGTPFPMALIICICTVCALISYLILVRRLPNNLARA